MGASIQHSTASRQGVGIGAHSHDMAGKWWQRRTFEVTLATTDPGAPIRPAFSRPWATRRGPMVFTCQPAAPT
jgi:hypothetical protein